jgi:hypothetical protein
VNEPDLELRTCPGCTQKLVPIARHPGVFEHAFCPHCDTAHARVGERGEFAYSGKRSGIRFRLNPEQGHRPGCTRREYRLHTTWITRGIELFLENRGKLWRQCHDETLVPAVCDFTSVTGAQVKVAACPDCRTYNVFLLDPAYGEEIACLFPFGPDDAPDIRSLQLIPMQFHELDSAALLALLDETIRHIQAAKAT